MADLYDELRATGRTTRLILKLALTMSENPGEWVQVIDHWQTRAAQENMARRLNDLCIMLKIEHERKIVNSIFYVRMLPLKQGK